MDELTKARIEHYELIKQDIREEIKQRISQRDNFAIQLIVVIGAILVAAMTNDNVYVLIFLPLGTLYFCIQILYSYSIHDVLHKFLVDEIEPALTKLLDTAEDHEWEKYYKKSKNHRGKVYQPGIRRNFYIYSNWISTLLVAIVLTWRYYDHPMVVMNIAFWKASLIVSLVYIGASLFVTRAYYKK